MAGLFHGKSQTKIGMRTGGTHITSYWWLNHQVLGLNHHFLRLRLTMFWSHDFGIKMYQTSILFNFHPLFRCEITMSC